MDPSQNNAFDSLKSPGEAGGASAGATPVNYNVGGVRPGVVKPEQGAGVAPQGVQPVQSVQPAQTNGPGGLSMNVGSSSNPSVPLSTGTGDIVLSNDGTKKDKLRIVLVVLLLVVVIGGIIGGIIALWNSRTGGGQSSDVTNSASDELADALYSDSNDDWGKYYKAEMEKVENALKNENDDEEMMNLQQRKDVLNALNSYKIIDNNYDAGRIVNGYLQNAETLRSNYDEILNGVNSISNMYINEYYDYEVQKYDLAIELAKRYEMAGCYDENRSVVFDCAFTEEVSGEVEQLISDIDDKELDVDEAVNCLIDYYSKLITEGESE